MSGCGQSNAPGAKGGAIQKLDATSAVWGISLISDSDRLGTSQENVHHRYSVMKSAALLWQMAGEKPKAGETTFSKVVSIFLTIGLRGLRLAGDNEGRH